jgi:type III pantothenate kinase
VVADIGNTRLKWGFCAPDGSHVADAVSLLDNPAAWQEEHGRLARNASKGATLTWVLASVRPQQCERLESWLREQGHRVHVLRRAAELPLTVRVPVPDHVGIDRLLDAVAAKRRLQPGEPAVLVDAGSAVTVDWLDEAHAFCGGTIFPGLRLMAQALNDHTALLPLVSILTPVPELPAPDTVSAMQAGILHAAAGGIERIVRLMAERSPVPPRVFLTGGDGPLLAETFRQSLPCTLWPWQTLEGILASAEALPE